uniref:Uncharacterized protein n=1 Tax=Meloidogyne floridensis TaxID=298350 RepID=A0A915PEL6_9BILA
MLLRNLILIFCFELASCGHGSAGQGGASYGNDGYWDENGYWIQGGVPSGQGYPNSVVGTTAWNQGYTQNQDTFHHLVGHSPTQGYAPSSVDGSTDWNQDGSNASYNFDGVTQQFGNLNLHGYDPSYVEAGGYEHIPIHTYGHTRTGGGRKKHSEDASSSRGKKIRKNNSPPEGLGNTGEGDEEVHEEEREHMPLSIDPNQAKSYRVEIYLKRFDGGTVLLLEPWTEELRHRNGVQEIFHEKYSTINVEKVVKALKIADVEYHPVEDIENHIKDAELYGNVTFNKGSGKLKADAGETISTKELANRIADWSNKGRNISNWMIEGKAYQNEIFEPLFDGHIMVLLHDLEDGIEKFRIHLTIDRLNLFDSVNKKNYFVIPHNGELVIMPEENVWNKGDPVRGTRWRDATFYSQRRTLRGTRRRDEIQVYTRPLTLYQLLNLAYYKVSPFGDKPTPFKCGHFGYEFIMAIAADEFKAGLLNYENWPENIRFIDDQLKEKEEGNETAFHHSSGKLAELAQFNRYNLRDYTRAIPFIPPNPVED